MKIAVPSRHGRLLALCGLSAALHLIILDLVGRYGAHSPPAPFAAAPLAIRIGPREMSAAATAPKTSANAASTGPLRRLTGHARVAAKASAPAPVADSVVAARTAAAPSPGTTPDPVGSRSNEDTPERPQPAVSVSTMQLRLQTRPPAAARLVYQVSAGQNQDGAGAAAFLDWRPDGDAYTLEMDGVLGRQSTTGTIGDDGIAPARAQESMGGQTLATSFDNAGRLITLPDGTRAAAQGIVMDGATLWVWLASIGNAAAGQLSGGISVAVADAGGVRQLSFDTVGAEDVDTGLGRMKAWHLAQVARPGETRVDAWLAPSLGWLPVQLRVTRADGSAATQVLQRREAAGAR